MHYVQEVVCRKWCAGSGVQEVVWRCGGMHVRMYIGSGVQEVMCRKWCAGNGVEVW